MGCSREKTSFLVIWFPFLPSPPPLSLLPLPCELMDYKMLGVTLGLGEEQNLSFPLPPTSMRALDEVQGYGAISGHSHRGLEKT